MLAGVSVRTLFNYFPTKGAAVIGRDPSVIDHVTDRLSYYLAGHAPFVALRDALLDDFVDTIDEAQLLRRFRLIVGNPELSAEMQSFLNEIEIALGARLQTDSARIDPFSASMLVSTATTAVRVSLLAWAEQHGRVSYTDLVHRAFDLVQAGFQPTVDDRGERGGTAATGSR